MNDPVASAASAIVTGNDVDWDSVEQVCRPAERRLLIQLRALQQIAGAHRVEREREPSTTDSIPVPGSELMGEQHAWGHLRMLTTLGRGSSGTVFRAWDVRLGREVAVKLLHGVATAPLEEARLLARVRHPNLVAVFGADRFAGVPGFWMELLQGRPLSVLVAEQGPFSAAEASLIGADVCSALAALHAADILHRDIKAQNVVRERGGRIVLMDLGLGRSTEQLPDHSRVDLAGTPLYMAPELFVGHAASPQSDVYSLGVLLFHLSSGEFPVVGSTVEDIRTAHRQSRRRHLRDVRPDLPTAFLEVVERALAQQPEHRFATAGEMEKALLSTASRSSPAPGADARSRSERRRRMSLPFAMAVAVLTLIAGTCAGTQLQRFVTAPPDATVPSQRDALAGGPLSEEQQKIALAFEELAGDAMERGDWTRAAEMYYQQWQTLRASLPEEAPAVAVAVDKLGWAQMKAGHPDAKTNLELAIAKFSETMDAHPLQTTAELALAVLNQRLGDHAAVERGVQRALIGHQRPLGGRDQQRGRFFVPGAIAEVSRRLRLDTDSDGDWLPDLFEGILGLNPSNADSDADGIADVDEQVDGRVNRIAIPLCVDPTKIVAHYGSLDPAALGFARVRDFPGRSVPAAGKLLFGGWKVLTSSQGYYHRRLPAAVRRAALARGWMMTATGVVNDGGAFVDLDLSPEGPRFDLDSIRADSGMTTVRLNTSAVPWEGLDVAVSRNGHWPISQLVYSPTAGSARLFVEDRLEHSGYIGHRQFQEGHGFVFGSHTLRGEAKSGDVDFGLAVLIVR